MAFSQLPLILLLVAKNNPITLLTGITYQKLNFLHRAASRACLLCSWIHAIAWTPRVWEKGHFSHAYLISGIIALFAFTMLWTTSLRIIRRVAWEFFIVTHIIFTLLFLVGAIFHWKKLIPLSPCGSLIV
ncbi:ferric-chelate reductase Frp1 [Vanrija albida]|uniref:Ferric-chelate reductase Frp1 n=1 Tax=Vanrija albida TaxID=181172 RepID=A0ABR3Q127_9TREE